MRLRTALVLLFLFAGPALAQSGLRVPLQGEPGLDPTLARGWLTLDFDRLAYAQQRMQWSYSLSDRYSLGMSMGNSTYLLEEQRQMSLYGRYSLTPEWALSAETLSRDASGLFTLRDFRIGVQRRF